MAYSGICVALGVFVMFFGGVLEIGMYTSPVFTGILLMLMGEKYGRKWHTSMYIATSALCVMLVPQPEANLMFAGFFGWYPIVRPKLQKLPKAVSMAVKFIIFNVAVFLIEYLVTTLLVPEILTPVMIITLLILANVTFIMYDILIPKMERVMKYYAKKLK